MTKVRVFAEMKLERGRENQHHPHPTLPSKGRA